MDSASRPATEEETLLSEKQKVPEAGNTRENECGADCGCGGCREKTFWRTFLDWTGCVGRDKTPKKKAKAFGKVLVLGLEMSGKSTLLNRLPALAGREVTSLQKAGSSREQASPPRVPATIGLRVKVIEISDVVFEFWEIGGSKAMQECWPNYVADIEGLVYVIDCTDFAGFKEAMGALKRVLKAIGSKFIPLLILLNKADVHGAKQITPFNVREELDGCRDLPYNSNIHRISALYEGVDQYTMLGRKQEIASAFHWLALSK